MTSDLITYELKNDIALLGLNRPDKHNALNNMMFVALAEAVERAGHEAKAGVIFGHGSHFSAGLDLAFAANDLLKADPVIARRRSDGSRRPMAEISRGPIPWVAALHGAVVGAGLELACCAHVRVAEREAFFALPEGQRGIFVGGGGSVRVQRAIGYERMADMMLTGRSYDAEGAERINAVQYVVDEGEALPKAIELAARITRNAALSNYAVTTILPRLGTMQDDEGLFFEGLGAQYVVTEESEQRLRDFLAKRAAPIERPIEAR